MKAIPIAVRSDLDVIARYADVADQLLFDAHMHGSYESYRAYRFAWNATPRTPPAVAASRQGRKMTVWASWNGATGVHYWRLLGGPSPTALRPVATREKQGFETILHARRTAYVQAVALGAKSRPLARSGVIQVDG